MKRVGLGKGQQLSESSKFGDRKFDVPNVVLHQLAKPAASSHPGADLLAAFSEQRLPKAEREGVLEHLAVCADCREVLSLAQVEVAAQPNVILPKRTTFLSWTLLNSPMLGSPMLRWGALGACAVIAISAVFLHKVNQSGKLADYARIEAKLEAPAEKLEPPKTPPVLPSQPSATTESRISAADAKPSSSLFRERGSAKGKEEDSYSAGKKLSNEPVRELDELKASGAVAGPVASKSADRAESGASVDGQRNEAASGEVLRADASNSDPQPARAKAADVEIRARAKVLSAQPGVAPSPAEKSSNAVVADASTPTPPGAAAVEQDKASGYSVAQKSAVGGAAANMQTTTELRKEQLKKILPLMRWRLAAGGSLERFADNQWQAASVKGKSSWLALATSGMDVWVGGAKGALYHSSDNGDHWTRQTAGGLDPAALGDIVNIIFNDARHGQLRTSTNQEWRTTDGGNTWTRASVAN